MIEFTKGDILKADVEAVINTVNTVGIMGKGLAKAFKTLYPTNFLAYEAACARREVVTGRMFVTENIRSASTEQFDMFGSASPDAPSPRWLINFPTKRHWRDDSQMEWIDSGLRALGELIETHDIRSIAIPPLGCGNGGLKWTEVRPRIVKALENVDDLQVLVFEPS